MGLELRRNLSGVHALDTGEWCLVDGRATFSCPLCSKLVTLEPAHRVDPAGKVTPPFDCPWCPFREFITLDSWRDA
jgi:hypothetical protein